MRAYEIDYDGFMVIEASNQSEAEKQANALLSKSGLPNDGSEGKWYLTSVEKVSTEE
jgi:hypothetical protein